MTDLSASVRDYLTVRRALGYKLESAERLLGQFVAYCDEVGAATITTELAVAWATLPVEAAQYWWGQRLGVVRRFAMWLQALEPNTEVPPADILGSVRTPRLVPYLYTDADIAALMDAAGRLRHPLSQRTYRSLVGLLAVTGMRVGEAIRLDRDDVFLDEGQLRVLRSKFDKSRIVVLHPTSVRALRAYADQRDQLCPRPESPSFFVSRTGRRLISRTVNALFADMVGWAGLQPRSERCQPRVHDLRHAFAVRTLIDWYEAGVDVEARLPVLSTYMGHVDPQSTYWYLSGAPELLALAARRLDQSGRGSSR